MRDPKTEHLTRLAKKLSKEKQISHCQALALIAKGLGFKTWSAYLESIKSNEDYYWPEEDPENEEKL